MVAHTRDIRIELDPPSSVQNLGRAGMIDPNLRFETEQNRETNALGILDRMMRPDDFMKMLQARAERREDMLMVDARDINLQWVDPSHSKPGHFAIAPSHKQFAKNSPLRDWFKTNKTMEVSSLGYKSACKQLKRSPDTYDQFENPKGRFLDEFHDMFRGSSAKGLLVRTYTPDTEDNRVVDAVLPGDYNPITNYQIMGALINRVGEVYGDQVRGIQVLEDDQLENVNYRVLFGNPIMREYGGDPTKILLTMLSFMGTERGINETVLDLGFWRLFCANGNMRQDIGGFHVGWRRFDSHKKFLDRAGGLIDMAGMFGDRMSERMMKLQDEKLVEDPMTVLSSLRGQKLLDKSTAETAQRTIEMDAPDTNWDFLNVLTDAAKCHGSMKKRCKAESNALMLAMQPSGFNGVVTKGFDWIKSRGDLREVAMLN